MELMIGFIVAISVTMMLIPPLIKIAPKWKFVDMPQDRKVHAQPIPRVGGIAMAIGVLLALAVCEQLAASSKALIAGIVVLAIFGAWDDRVALSASAKFLGQFAAVGIVMYFGHVSIGSLTLTDRYAISSWLSVPLTLFFLVGATNAINLADGLDGLAGGTTLLCLAGLALLAFTVGNVQVGGIALLIVGSVLGFLRYNTHPARVFMGDTGSQLLGFSAAVLSIMLTQGNSVTLSSALPLLLLGVPIIDTLAVMITRIVAGESPFKADRRHIHHRLLSLGFRHHEAVILIYLAQSIFFVTAWLARFESDALILALFASLSFVLLASLELARRSTWRFRAHPNARHSSLSSLQSFMAWLIQPDKLPRWCLYVIALSVALFSFDVLLAKHQTPVDAIVLALLSVAALAISMAVRWSKMEIGWFEKSLLYVGATLVVFLHETRANDTAINWIPIIAIAIAVAIRVRLSADRRFTITPLDVLVVLAALLIPNLPNSIASPQALGAGVVKVIALFYGVETLCVNAQRQWKWLSACAMIVFAGIAVGRL